MTNGEISLHSWAPLPSGFTVTRDMTSGLQRRVSFSQIRGGKSVAKPAKEERASSDTSAVMSIPTPTIVAALSWSSGSDGNNLTLHVDVITPPIEVHPTSVILWQEYVLLDSTWKTDKLERATTLLQGLRLQDDVMFPMPRTFITQAMEWAMLSPGRQTSIPELKTVSSNITSQTLIHVCVTPFRVSATCSPVSATSVSVCIEDQGAINFIMSSKTALRTRTTNYYLGVRKLRVEVQTRMEVKFLEVSVPEASIDINAGQDGTYIQCALSDSSKKETFETIVRLTHVSQWLIISQLWQQKATEAQASLSQYQTTNPSATQPVDQPVVSTPTHLVVAVELDRGIVKLELGTSNKHEITIGKVVTTLGTTPKGSVLDRKRSRAIVAESSLSIVDVLCSDVSVRFDGQATGSLAIDQGIILRRASLDPLTDDSFPTSQMYLSIPHVRASLRERHVKDILSTELGGIRLRMYDENIAGTVPQHNVFVDACTERTTIAMSAEFLSATGAIITEINTTLEGEQSVARTKLESHKFYMSGRVRKAGETSFVLEDDALAAIIPFVGRPMQVMPTGQVRILIRDVSLTLGELSHASDAAALLVTVQSLVIEYAQCLDRTNMRKVLQFALNSWDVYRKSSEKRSSIIGAKGANTFDLTSSQGLGMRDVNYTFAFKCENPWHGSPHMVDFEVINKTVASYSKATETPDIPSPPPPPDERIFRAKRSTRFAPELRVVSDAVINIDTVLGWLGMREDAIPRLLYVSIADGLEGVVYGAYMATVPLRILEAERMAIRDAIIVERTPSNASQVSVLPSPALSATPSTTPAGGLSASKEGKDK